MLGTVDTLCVCEGRCNADQNGQREGISKEEEGAHVRNLALAIGVRYESDTCQMALTDLRSPCPNYTDTFSSLAMTPSISFVRSLGKYRRAGFTLIEILVVIVVIAILATLVAPNIFQHVGAAKSATAKAQIEMLGAALDAYRLDNGSYPNTQQGLLALWEKPSVDAPANWRTPYLRKAVPLDPWGRPYAYLFPGQHNAQGYDLISYGADGKAGGEGDDADVASWK